MWLRGWQTSPDFSFEFSSRLSVSDVLFQHRGQRLREEELPSAVNAIPAPLHLLSPLPWLKPAGTNDPPPTPEALTEETHMSEPGPPLLSLSLSLAPFLSLSLEGPTIVSPWTSECQRKRKSNVVETVKTWKRSTAILKCDWMTLTELNSHCYVSLLKLF